MEQILTPRFATGSRTERAVSTRKRCGHARHCGHCPECQRAQLAKWNAQLAQATQIGRRW
jgi:bacterioferritin-associated ferredoxin